MNIKKEEDKMQTKEELLSRLSDCVCDMEDDEVVDVVKE